MIRVLLSLLFAMCTWSTLAAQPQRAPVPPEDKVEAAKKLVAEIYKRDNEAAKTPALKQALAKRLLNDAANTADDPAAKFVLFQVARKLAIQAGDVPLALSAIAAAESAFAMDGLPERQNLLEALVAEVRDPALSYDLLALIHDTQAAAIQANRFDVATALNEQLTKVSKKINDPTVRKQVEVRSAEVAEIAAAWAPNQAALKTLDASPIDGAANQVAGRFLLLKGDWDRALPMLALAKDKPLQKLAELELQGSNKPEAAAALTDGWWAIAADRTGWERTQCQSRAVHHMKAMWNFFAPLIKAKYSVHLARFATDNQDSIARWNAYRIEKGNIYPWHVALDGTRGGAAIRTLQDFQGPLDINVVARTNRHNIRVSAYGRAEVIWNWEVRSDELRMHRPDGSIAAKKTTALTVNRFHALRWVMQADSIAVSTNRIPVFTERGNYDLRAGTVAVYSGDSLVDVRSISIKAPGN